MNASPTYDMFGLFDFRLIGNEVRNYLREVRSKSITNPVSFLRGLFGGKRLATGAVIYVDANTIIALICVSIDREFITYEEGLELANELEESGRTLIVSPVVTVITLFGTSLCDIDDLTSYSITVVYTLELTHLLSQGRLSRAINEYKKCGISASDLVKMIALYQDEFDNLRIMKEITRQYNITLWEIAEELQSYFNSQPIDGLSVDRKYATQQFLIKLRSAWEKEEV